MTTERDIGSDKINIFIISNDHDCDFYNTLNLKDFHRIFRQLLLEADIETYEEFVSKINGAISIDKLRNYMIDGENPTYEDFLIIAGYFRIPPETFIEYRQQRQRKSILQDEIENLFSGRESDRDAVPYTIGDDEINAALLSDADLDQLENMLRG